MNIVRVLIGAIRWLIIHCIIKPLVERYVVRPLYGVLVDDGLGDVIEEDAKLGGGHVSGEVGGETEEDTEEDGENIV